MAVTKTITIDEIPVTFKASAAIPRMYRVKFGRDIYKDMRLLEKSVEEGNEEASTLDTFSLELFENMAWLLAYAADQENVPETPEEWLEQFNTFSIYQVLPEIIDLWGLNVKSDAESKKNSARLTGK